MVLQTPRARGGVPDGSVASRLKVDLDGAGVVQEPDYVEPSGEESGELSEEASEGARWDILPSHQRSSRVPNVCLRG